ncbi:metallophosphoesterase [Parabacteroides sp. OttesenSCG-928-B22]|nr:metallophosphoesterase [Parabacteroides sp. OttesenSCG-928-B22]
MKVFLQSIIAQLILTPFICWRGYQAIPPKKSWRIPYTLFFLLELLVFFTGFFFHSLLPDRVFITIMLICSTWYIASVYITMAILLLELIRFTHRLWPWYPAWVAKQWRRIKTICFVCITVGVTLLMIHAYHRVMYPTVTHVNVYLDKPIAGRDSLTIVMMSDLHIGEVIAKKQVQRFVAMSNQQQPDMVVLVGDIMDYESRFAEKARIEEDLQQLQAPLGTYVVYGNHEYRANRHAKTRWLQKTGATLLVDSVVMPDSAFYLIGRDDYINKERKPLRALTKELDHTKPIILLDHQPWSLAESAMNGVDLGLYGHTHHGQIWPYPLLMNVVYENPYGYSRKGNTQFYVSSGIGIAGPPYRVGTLSEMVVLHLFSCSPQKEEAE